MAAATRLSKEIITGARRVMVITVRATIIIMMSTGRAGRLIMADRRMTIINRPISMKATLIPLEGNKTTRITGCSLAGNTKTTDLIGKTAECRIMPNSEDSGMTTARRTGPGMIIQRL
jgi:hypothetical protein